ncbi:SDR family NAD(P)-dependent oxidoreductase [Mycolicibacterium agri]|uniref:SDR family NAD(P)-dependent oxidoreductase n=1 Tax=Mycolicibacterium agri TaxID=36811 RepID=UPI0013CFCCFB|nr:SDR family NAD(P)-dependent oxidoreductase [Mycolicibacterium agri]
MNDFAGKTALVTGGASGMGLATVRRLAGLGVAVVAADVRSDAVDEAARQLADAKGSVRGVRLDITDRDQCEQVTNEVQQMHGGIDYLVNCAGSAMSFTPLEKISKELYDSIIRVNLDGTFNLCQAVVPHMKARGSGAIVNFASAVAARPRPGLSPYTAAKAGVIALTKTLALDLAEEGIRVNCILPGATDSPMLPKFVGEDADLDAARAVYISSIPMGRLATPEDIAGGVEYLLSDSAGFVTGETLSIDGGRGV